MIRAAILIAVLTSLTCAAWGQVQEDPAEERPPYNRKEEIIFRNKRYRIHNNYLTLGAGAATSSRRNLSQRVMGADFQFHVRRQHFQAGVMMSGDEFLSNNQIQAHLGYGLRKESNLTNLAVFLGPAYHSGVTGNAAGLPEFYQGFAMYASAQAVVKLAYDIGIGIEIFDELSPRQNLFGFKVIAFFSGAYRGVKRNFNPNLRSEQ
jgi:hypothetical protein